MPFTVVCPSCSARIKAPDTAVGKTVKCPKCSNPMIISASAPEPTPEVVEPVEVVESPEPEEVAPRRRQRPRRDDDDSESRPRKKKSNKGLIIGLSIGGVLLVSLCCCGGGLGMYYGVFDSVVGNDKVTKANYDRLKVDMSQAEVEAILGKGRSASQSDVRDVFKTAGGGIGHDTMSAQVESAFLDAVSKGTVLKWKNGEDILLVRFNAPQNSGGKARYFIFREKKGKNSSTSMNGSLNP